MSRKSKERKTKDTVPAGRRRVSVILSEEFIAGLTAIAKSNGRSLTKEIEFRLMKGV